MNNKELFKFISKDDKESCDFILQGLEMFHNALSEGIMWSCDPTKDQEDIQKLEKLIETIKEII